MSSDDTARPRLRQASIELGDTSEAIREATTAGKNAPTSDNHVSAEAGPSIYLFDPAEIRGKIGDDQPDPDLEIGDRPPEFRSDDELRWVRQLRKLLDDPKTPARRLVVADASMVERIDALRLKSPHFSEVIGLVARAAKLSLVTQSPLIIPPILLLGRPGIGKSFFAQSLAEAIGTHLERIAMDMLSDHGALIGLSLSWRAARPGRIALGLLGSATASPIFFLDEVEKVNAVHAHENPLAFLHSVLEQENARRFADEYLTISMRADHAIWILTANTTKGLADSILDRLTVFSIPEPDREALRSIVKSIYAATNAQFNHTFEPELDPQIVETLAAYNPRMIGKLLRAALGFAIEDDRAHISDADIESARSLIDTHVKRSAMGFLRM